MRTSFLLVILMFVGKTLTTTSSDATADCDVFEYYDVRDGQCRHCDTACFQRVNETYIQFVESGCHEACPGYLDHPHIINSVSDDAIDLSMMEGAIIGFIAAVIIVSIIIVLIWRRNVAYILKGCCRRAKSIKRLAIFEDEGAFGETSYVRLADPSDEVEIVYRVTCV